MSRRHNQGMLEYLDSIGVLQNGTDAEIKVAKNEYRKEYLLKYKRTQRKVKPEFNICFSNDTGEYGRVSQEAKRHKMTVTGFIRSATLAYINKTFIVPDRAYLARLELILAQCLNEIQGIVTAKQHFWDRGDKYDAIEKRIERLETDISKLFREPLPVEEIVKSAVAKEPTLKDQLLAILAT